ncbi:hypothetical protein [Pontibacter akesuensis]|uniref:TonB protein C-terminal n=1 Tax=Pontibacter akesuensis TaxID=388950 RepID=A0A1I7FQ04_9BACT|nr:hypothetical protein [Pontibacter akesuensis]GHA61058.1 hypothetical protein GCM10007389_11810 [Pontibacter akesuensis]SFU38253.1 hypothetical protein SAMN04487941_0381 [Pontibacter akesuensis]
MIKSTIIAAALCLAALQGHAQTGIGNYGPEPIGGTSKVALPFYKINFSEAQKQLLQQKEIELVFFIDEEGLPTLEDIKGTTDAAILDSLRSAAANIPLFHPRTVNGVKESALYFLQFQLPVYEPAAAEERYVHYKTRAHEDFEYIHKSGQRLDILMGAVANTFLGKPNEYLQPGGGMKLDMMFTGKKGFGGGMVMSFYGNKLKQPYPISSGREQNSAPPMLMLGVAANKAFAEKERTEFNAQLELAYAVQNVTPKLEYEDEDWVQLKGFSPGVVVNYLIKLGKDRASFYYGAPTLYNHYLNVHGAVRPVFFNLKEATGLMLEVGLSYRLGTHFVDEYRLKQ